MSLVKWTGHMKYVLEHISGGELRRTNLPMSTLKTVLSALCPRRSFCLSVIALFARGLDDHIHVKVQSGSHSWGARNAERGDTAVARYAARSRHNVSRSLEHQLHLEDLMRRIGLGRGQLHLSSA